jgi:hypothetical protein
VQQLERLQLAGAAQRPGVDWPHPAGGHQPGDRRLRGRVVAGQEHVQRQPRHLPGQQGGGERGAERLDHPWGWEHARDLAGDLLGGRHAGAGQQRVERGEVDRVARVDHGQPGQRGALLGGHPPPLRVWQGKHDDVRPRQQAGQPRHVGDRLDSARLDSARPNSARLPRQARRERLRLARIGVGQPQRAASG